MISALFFLLINLSSNHSAPSIQMIVNDSSLNNIKIVKNIERELSNVKGISFYEVSLQSNALLVNYNHEKVDDKHIMGILKKWGCEINSISFNPIFN
tara:strand:+ start:1191 stop:1481 length:291 start_codon:yes stop_codon:yes gene_type:complete